MKTILFPTDFSANAIHAAQYAGMLATQLKAQVVLLHAYPIPVISDQEIVFDTEISVLQSEKEAAQNLEFFANKFMEDTGLVADQITQMVEYGATATIILDVAQKTNADLIVMGTKGTTNAIDRWIGTNARDVMQSAACPVWIVPQNAPLHYPRHIMYAADFKEDEVAATHKIVALAKPLGATCRVVHIHEYFEMSVGQTVEETVAELEEEFKNEDVSVKNLNRNGIIDGLETYIKAQKPDVLALAVYDKSFLSRIFERSVSGHFVQAAKLPMLIFRK